jgi:hypothetical protein
MNDTEHIRQLIERWALAVHEGNMTVVLEDHAPDIVMFDVPPPEQGVRGRPRRSSATRNAACASPSACARRTGAGWCPTSTTRSPTRRRSEPRL